MAWLDTHSGSVQNFLRKSGRDWEKAFAIDVGLNAGASLRQSGASMMKEKR